MRLDPRGRAAVLATLQPRLAACPAIRVADIGVWPKTAFETWTAGDDTHCCAGWGTRNQIAFLRSPLVSHLLIRRRASRKTLALVVLLLGEDERTLLLNSVQMARGCLRNFGGRDSLLAVLRAFLVPYARRHQLTRIHASGWFARLFGTALPRARELIRPAEHSLPYHDLYGPRYVVWQA